MFNNDNERYLNLLQNRRTHTYSSSRLVPLPYKHLKRNIFPVEFSQWVNGEKDNVVYQLAVSALLHQISTPKRRKDATKTSKLKHQLSVWCFKKSFLIMNFYSLQ